MDAAPLRGDFATGAAGIALVLAAIAVAWALSRFLLYRAAHPAAHFWFSNRVVAPCTFQCHAWSEFGLARPKSLPFAALATLLLYGAVWVLLNYVGPYIAGVVGAESAASILANVPGNFPRLCG